MPKTATFAIILTLISFTAYAADPTPPRKLNNLVIELFSVDKLVEPDAAISFENPRRGWVFISISDDDASLVHKASFNEKSPELVWRPNPDTAACESMQYLTVGRHTLHIQNAQGARVDVHAIPELMYCYYPTKPHIAAYGLYDWNYAGKYILPHVNVIVTRSEVPQREFDQWRAEGRRWVSNASLLGLSDKQSPEPGAVLKSWAGNPGTTRPEFSGIIVDEFGGVSAEHYAAWTEALKRLDAMPEFNDKLYYAWCTDLPNHEPALPFCRTLMDLGHLFTWEVYMREQDSLENVQKRSISPWLKDMQMWKASLPKVEDRMVMCLGYLSAPPETLNSNPQVDYHVFLDMQFHALATAPEFDGLYGIMEYMADYADEESLRYAHQLFRHYAIEGKTDRFNNDPYMLPHLQNPDFADGMKNWTVKPAERNAIGAGSMKDFSWLQGRYPETKMGDTFCKFQRSHKKPSAIKQTLRNLTPGRLYSIKYIAADMTDLHQHSNVTLGVEIKDADILEQYAFEYVYPSCYNHESGPYTHEKPAMFTWRRLVFRPEKESAELVISDWRTPSEQGGPTGQQIAVNFLEVQPFHAPEK